MKQISEGLKPIFFARSYPWVFLTVQITDCKDWNTKIKYKKYSDAFNEHYMSIGEHIHSYYTKGKSLFKLLPQTW